MAGILNTGSFPGPVYSFTLTIESVYLIRSKVDHPFASLVWTGNDQSKMWTGVNRSWPLIKVFCKNQEATADQ